MNLDLYNFLSQYITEERFETFQHVIEKRSRYLTVALEDIFQPHNASAVLRSCDCFGIQDVHIIENRNTYTINPDVALGASKWLNLVKYNQSKENTLSAIEALRSKGYRIIATTPHKNDVDLHNFELTKGKTALFFGTEKQGLSETVLQNADEFLKIPMYGFTESFNISVSAAIVLHYLSLNMRRSDDIEWQLSDAEKKDILIQWMKHSITHGDLLVKQFYKTYSKKD